MGAPITISNDKATVIMGRMRMPSLSVHVIEGGSAKTVIPASVSCQFSIRLVIFGLLPMAHIASVDTGRSVQDCTATDTCAN